MTNERQGLTEEEKKEADELFPNWDEEEEPASDTEQAGESENEEEEKEPEGQQAQKPEPFKFTDEQDNAEAGGQSPGDGQSQEQEYVDIKHRGQIHRVTKEKAVELAQKGFDYDVKVGPDARLVQLIKSDPGAAQMLDQYFRTKMSGQQQPQQSGYSQQTGQPQQQESNDPLQGYDDDDVLTAADAKKLYQKQQEALQQQWQQMQQQATQQQQEAMQQQQAQAQQGGANQIQMMLQSRDPQYFRQVQPYLQSYANQLRKDQFDRVNADPGALCEFYDYVRSQVVGDQLKPAQSQKGTQSGGSFRAQSGGGEPPRGKDKTQKIWEMPKKDFEAQMAKIKGY